MVPRQPGLPELRVRMTVEHTLVPERREAGDARPHPDTATRPARRRRAPVWLSAPVAGWVIEAVLVSAAVSAVYLALYRPWGWRLRVPLSYTGDGNFYAMVVKTMQLRGGYDIAPGLGAPHGQFLYDFPLGGDHLHIAVLKLLSLVMHDPYMVTDAYFAMTFVVIALSAQLVARSLGLRPLTAGMVSVLFAFAEYHFWHGASHLFLSAYYAVPLGILLVVWCLDDRVPVGRFGDRAGSEPAAASTRRLRLLAVCGCVIVVGSADSYYAIFTVLILIGAALVDALRRGSWRAFLVPLLVIAAIGAVQVINLLPELLYRLQHGANPLVAKRGASESEFYGLHLTRLVVPPPGHRFRALAALGRRTLNVGYVGEDDSYLGFLGAIGLVVAVAHGLGAMLREHSVRTPRLVRQLGLVILLAVLIGTVGGVGFLIAVLGFTQIRGWSRITPFIDFAALVSLGLLVERWLIPRWSQRRRARVIIVVAAVAITGIGLADQIPHGYQPEDVAATRVEKRSDQVFVNQMERALPKGASVFELPIMKFPENGPIVNLLDYDLLKGYLLGSGRLDWSYGGLNGRESADWQQVWARQPIPRLVEGVAAAGFSALYVDRNGFADQAAALDSALQPIVGPAAFQSPDGRLRWYDLRPEQQLLSARLGAGTARVIGQDVVTPIVLRAGAGVYREEQASGTTFRWMQSSGTIVLQDDTPGQRAITLHLLAAGSPGHVLTIRGGGVAPAVPLQDVGTPLDLPLTVSAGQTVIKFTTDAPRVPSGADQRDLHARLVDITVSDAAVDQLPAGS
jgi:phosphoglycerol transferase